MKVDWKTGCFSHGFEIFVKSEISFCVNAQSLLSHIWKTTFTTGPTKLKFWKEQLNLKLTFVVTAEPPC